MNHRNAVGVAGLLVSCTLVSLAGTDLVLPAVPSLPDALGGSITDAQMVLASFAAGTGVGLLAFGELGARIDHRKLLFAAMVSYGLLSMLAAVASSIELLIGLRFIQGFSAACAAVVTPGMVRALFDEAGALRALGVLGSVESLAPAIAPIIGVWLLAHFGWQGSFWSTAILALTLALLLFFARSMMPELRGKPSRIGYLLLLRNTAFQRHALSQGTALAALLVFVFAMPTVFVVALGGTLTHFIIMQLIGISSFILAANMTSVAVRRFGDEQVILMGSTLAFAGAGALLAYGLIGGGNPWVIAGLFLPLNFGFGLRGPPGFHAALQACDGDDARASALIILYVMLLTAGGTGVIAPFLAAGLWPGALGAVALSATSLLIRARRPG